MTSFEVKEKVQKVIDRIRETTDDSIPVDVNLTYDTTTGNRKAINDAYNSGYTHGNRDSIALLQKTFKDELESSDSNHTFKVVTLCGSTRFRKEFAFSEKYLTLSGYIVLNIAPFYKTYDNYFPEIDETVLNTFQEMHYQRIRMADIVYIIDPDHYIGDSTKKEIEYAKSLDKRIMYYSSSVSAIVGEEVLGI